MLNTYWKILPFNIEDRYKEHSWFWFDHGSLILCHRSTRPHQSSRIKCLVLSSQDMIVTKSAFVASLLLSGFCDAALRNRKKNEVKRKVGDGQRKALFKDEEGFWMRFVQEVATSIPPPTQPPGTCGGSVSLLFMSVNTVATSQSLVGFGLFSPLGLHRMRCRRWNTLYKSHKSLRHLFWRV